MKKYSKFLLVVLALTATLISACGGTTAAAGNSAGSDKPLASLVEFTGVIEAIDGNQWTINGQVLTVDPVALGSNTFAVGDTVQIEAEVQADGSVVVTNVGLPSANDGNSNDENSNTSIDNSNSNSNDNTNTSIDDNSNDENSNDDDSNNGNSNDDDSNEDNSNDDDSNDDDSNDDKSNDDDSDDDNSNSGSEDNDNSSNENG